MAEAELRETAPGRAEFPDRNSPVAVHHFEPVEARMDSRTNVSRLSDLAGSELAVCGNVFLVVRGQRARGTGRHASIRRAPKNHPGSRLQSPRYFRLLAWPL